MSEAHRHPGSGWLLDYARGNISPAFEVVIATHLLGCDVCRADLRVAEQLGAELMAHGAPQTLPFSADDVMNAPEPRDTAAEWRPAGCDHGGSLDLTAVVRNYLAIGLDALRWRGFGGVRVARLRSSGDEQLWLLHARPGAVLPRHTHRGAELTVVLQGAYVVDDQVFAAGDIEDADEETRHQPIVTTVGECLCLAATSAPLVFESIGARLVQHYLGI